MRLFLVASFASCLVGCSFIADFDYAYSDAGVDGAISDGGGDTTIRDGGDATADSTVPPTCTAPCLGDAVSDFDPSAQSAGSLAWRYLADDRTLPGLVYGELAPETIHDAPAWTDLSAPPAIVACGTSTTGPCVDASGGLVFETDSPGTGLDPVLAFTAPMDGTYALLADVRGINGAAEVLLGRNGRFDTVGSGTLSPTETDSLTPTIDLFAGETGLMTVRPTGLTAVTVAGRLRVSTAPATAPLASCELAMRFEDEDDRLKIECTTATATELETTITTHVAGPGPSPSGARDFPYGSALALEGARLDYSGDFTIQVWAQVDQILDVFAAIYADISFFGGAAGGVGLGVEPRGRDGSDGEIAVVNYGFPTPIPVPPSDPALDCDASSCEGEIIAPLPGRGSWHFFRIVRDAAASEVRFCIDGEHVGSAPLPGDIDISNPGDPRLGTSTGFTAERSFDGAIDDLRIVTVVLPCGP